MWKQRISRRRDVTRDRLIEHAQTTFDAIGEVVWKLGVEAVVERAHRHAAGAPRSAQRRGAIWRRPRDRRYHTRR